MERVLELKAIYMQGSSSRTTQVGQCPEGPQEGCSGNSLGDTRVAKHMEIAILAMEGKRNTSVISVG